MTGASLARPAPVTGENSPQISAEDFRSALARHAAGVVVVTARPDPGPAGLTATSFTSVSLDPPLVSFYVAQSSTTLPGLREASTFAVNVLGHDQSALAARFAARDVDRFAEPTRWSPGPAGEPLLDGAVAYLLCEWYATYAVGDHWLIVGRVTGIGLGEAEAPLLYHRGAFGRFHPHPS
ncbi:MAG: flavin reductase domain protein FMN-binding protein [Actinomycetia bacterium]|nr:flavin reductase domain protein FMN-binding protein [Actinomycetes bacterium]